MRTDGTRDTVAGTGWQGYSGDGGPATKAQLFFPKRFAVAADGTLYINDYSVIRHVTPDGIINRFAGGGSPSSGIGDLGPATYASLSSPAGVAAGKDGIYIADAYNHRVRRVGYALPGFTDTDIAVPSADAAEVYVFNKHGRHLRTLNALTKAVLHEFGYDASGFLVQISDGDGAVTTIERGASGAAGAIVAPDGQRTALAHDPNGYLAAVTDPAGATTRMYYDDDGLLTTFAKPRGHASTMTYDAMGRLEEDRNAAGGFWRLSRNDQSIKGSGVFH